MSGTQEHMVNTGELSLAVMLGIAPATPPAVRVPSMAQRMVPGRSPLEATGWAVPDDVRELTSSR
ncbi:hypothetical protein [Cellulomonas palmilytica]|uniref:hypothetical protein n=1 Tax=Cellulomonas palmilytica TaxID=2608402 RepID=UPI001F3FA2C9|nr:hypothetical protein [Cellulomonas palmilytica]UJP40367.1 hypothetical protein F1D97_02195 [Cellulomonas palmilytica]